MKSVLGAYTNGNYNVILLDDGTKIRSKFEFHTEPEMFESADIKITDKCSHGCPWCHEGCTSCGEHANIKKYYRLFESMHPYTELAIGGGNVMECPDVLREVLELAQANNLIPSITLHYQDFLDNEDDVKELLCDKLIYGLGISMPSDPAGWEPYLLDKIAEIPSAVCHCIFGVTPAEAIKKGYNRNLSLLLLGYKYCRRGQSYGGDNVDKIGDNKRDVEKLIPDIINHGLYRRICFDNLGVSQTNLRFYCENSETWNKLFMGNDGEYTMYIDLVNEQFAKGSGSFDRYKLNPEQSAREIFSIVRRERLGQKIGTLAEVHCDTDSKYYHEPGEYRKAEEEGAKD